MDANLGLLILRRKFVPLEKMQAFGLQMIRKNFHKNNLKQVRTTLFIIKLIFRFNKQTIF